MKTQLLAAAIFAFSTFAVPQISQAGNLYHSGQSGPAYQYGDRGSYSGARSLKDPPYTAPFAPSYKDQSTYNDRGNYPVRRPKSDIRYYGDGYNGDYCKSRRQIRRHLRRYGWFDFHNMKIRHRVIKINAQRGDGCIFRLRVDRCTGAILRKHLVYRPQTPYYGGSNYQSYGYRRGRNYSIY